jgi:virginiamycin B lyase
MSHANTAARGAGAIPRKKWELSEPDSRDRLPGPVDSVHDGSRPHHIGYDATIRLRRRKMLTSPPTGNVPMKLASGIASIFLAAAASAPPSFAGGSNYGVAPGSLAEVQGKVSEWSVPTPKFARDPAPGPDGNIYIAVMHGNKIARFDTGAQKFTEWNLPAGARPHGLLVDKDGIVWYTGNGSGAIGRLDPKTGKVIEYPAPSGDDPHTLVIDTSGIIWFTVQSGNRIGRLDRASGKITEYKTSGRPYGIAIDREGYVWFCRLGGDKLGRLDPRTGAIIDLDTGDGSAPRRMAVAPDGMLWVTGYGNGKLIKVDPRARKILKQYDMPAGRRGGPYAVTVDAAGRVWANEIATDTVALLEPKTDAFRVIKLPSQGIGIRKAIVDAKGRYWYMGSHNGRLGVVE